MHVEHAAVPPGAVVAAGQQHAELVGAVDDLVEQHPVGRLQDAPPHGQLVQRRDGRVGEAVRVVHGRPVDGGAVVVVHGEVLADAERLAVADQHPDDLARRDPRAHQRAVALGRQRDLVARAGAVRDSARRQHRLVGAPAELGRRRGLLVQPLDRPGVDELVLPLRDVGDLQVALADVDRPDAQQHRQPWGVVGVAGGGDGGVPVVPGHVGVGEPVGGQVVQPGLDEVRHEARVRTVVEHRGRPGPAPAGRLGAQPRVAGVERAGSGVLGQRVGVPQLHAGVDVGDAALVAPRQQVDRVEVVGQVDEQPAGRHGGVEDLAVVGLRHLVVDQPHAQLLGQPPGGPAALGVHPQHVGRRERQGLQQQREGAPAEPAGAEDDERGSGRESVGEHADTVVTCCPHPGPQRRRQVPHSARR